MNVAVNVSTIFTEYPFLERFQKVKEAGFSHVECQFPYDFSADQIKKELENHDLSIVLINLPPGDIEKGDFGLAIDPHRMKEFHQSVQQGIEYAKTLNVKKVHCMAGIVHEDLDVKVAKETFLKNIEYAANACQKEGITVLIEPINPFDVPNYFLNDVHVAAELIDQLSLPNVKLQFDFYHMERIHGKTIDLFNQFLPKIGHIQIADHPGRNEPGTGEMDYEKIFQAISKSSYNGFIGLEYKPKEKSVDSFQWMGGIVK